MCLFLAHKYEKFSAPISKTLSFLPIHMVHPVYIEKKIYLALMESPFLWNRVVKKLTLIKIKFGSLITLLI